MVNSHRKSSWTNVKCFVKEESYPEYKTCRGIFSRKDEFKVIVGPLIHAIEEKIFAHPAFIKKIPVDQRAKYVRERLGIHPRYYNSDYTSYEAHFKKALMEAIEIPMYRWMIKNRPDLSDVTEYFIETITGVNHLMFNDISLNVDATRMSGEMNTSLGNGFANYIMLRYLCHKGGDDSVTPVVEGDDGLMGTTAIITEKDFERVGLTCKLDEHNDLSTTSFCGLLFDYDASVNITNPYKVLIKTPWVARKYVGTSYKMHMRLLKAKALSILWQYPGCPIIQEYGKYLLRMTYKVKANFSESDPYHINHVDIKDNNILSFEDQLKNTPYKRISISTRLLMEKIFKINVSYQKHLEKFFESKNDLSDYNIDLSPHVHSDVMDFYNKHVFEIPEDCNIQNMKHSPIDCVNNQQKTKVLKLLERNLSKSLRKKFASHLSA